MADGGLCYHQDQLASYWSVGTGVCLLLQVDVFLKLELQIGQRAQGDYYTQSDYHTLTQTVVN